MVEVPRGSLMRLVVAVLVRPSLWATALRQLATLARPGWWRRRPYLPIPDPDYVRFRMITAYGGDGEVVADPDDLITYLTWCKRWQTEA